ncbi:Molybdate-binding periplasmic protein precursor [Posidoniimonas polymericola]|uniref:Molybdate-binding periplasmic protein n=1 Tax=Posidoniimonas polymericola TaxID=2528002 RepID=A0A5C5YL14_9BACT|nr:molybdate ABC transporter substrate-binding protein [Posidoniimonas polymericola]TWT75547.1 Molybdate-binding periplasmic protein precursor [Posidoniimonas polymericola]
MSQFNPLTKLIAGCLIAIGVLVALLPSNGPNRSGESLMVYCAASLRRPLEEVAARFEGEEGVSVQLQFGGSNTLLSQIEASRQGDLFLSADRRYLDVGRERGLIGEIISVAQMRPVVVVRRGRGDSVRTLDDLLELRLASGSPDQAAIGRVTRDLLRAAGRWDAFDQRVRTAGVYKPTVNDVAADVVLGSVDAGIVWDALAAQMPELEAISLPELAEGRSEIGIGVLTSSKAPAAALRFARNLIADDGGAEVFRSYGYQAVATAEGRGTTESGAPP